MRSLKAAAVTRRALLSLTLLAVSSPLAALAQPKVEAEAQATAQSRWQHELKAFVEADRSHPPPPGGVVFVGSSTIRLWSRLAQDFPEQPMLLNRGFGGSTLADCSLLASQLVTRYQPRLVVVYAGDNDLAEGRTPMQLLESFGQLVRTVRAELPDTRIAYISIKPSPARENLLATMREANHMIEAYLQRLPNSDYINVFKPMLDADGRPRAELFRRDQLHLSDEGYRLWQSVIAPHLQPVAEVPAAQPAHGIGTRNGTPADAASIAQGTR